MIACPNFLELNLSLVAFISFILIRIDGMVRLTFYGGINEIGGNKIFLQDRDTKLFFDFGFSFSTAKKYFSEFLQPRVANGLGDFLEFGILPDLEGIYRDDYLKQMGRKPTVSPDIDGVFLSHAHADHSWNIAFLHKDVPIYCGKTCKLFLKAAQESSHGGYGMDFHTYREAFVDRKARLECERNFHIFKTGDRIKIGSVEIVPIHVDHCLSPDTLIQLHNGEIKRVSEINDKEQILSFDFSSNKVITSASKRSRLKANNLLKIVTSLNEIKTTPEHKFICLNGLEFIEKKASELKTGDYIIYFKQIPFSGRSQDLPEFKPRTIVKPSKKGLEIIRNKRKELNLTKKQIGKLASINHKFYGVFEQGKHSCSLEILERLLSILHISKDDFISNYCTLPRVSIPTKTSVDLCQLLGYMIGNGSWDPSGGYIKITDKDIGNLKIYSDIVEKLFSFKPKIKTEFRKSGKLNVLFLPTFIAKFILFITPEILERSPKRKVPTIIQKVSLEELASFIRGLYDAEGSVGHHSIVLTNVSKELIDVVKLLLLRVGIISWVDETYLPLTSNLGYQLVISNPNSIKIFCEKIRFGSKIKQYKLERMIKKVGNAVAERIDLVPIGGETIRKILSDIDISIYFLQKHGLNIGRLIRGKHIPSRRFLKRFVNLLKKYSEELKLEYKELIEKVNYYVEKLEKIISSPFLFLRIKSIDVLPNYGSELTVYDFYVPESNNLIANGFLVHNSIPGSYGFIIHTSDNTIVYTADIRIHGPRRQMTYDFIAKVAETKPDLLIVEGTRIEEKEVGLAEWQVEQKINEAISRTKQLVLVNFPLRDMDRLNSFYRVCRATGRKLAITTKQAYLLEILKEDKNLNIPRINDENILIYLHRAGWGRVAFNGIPIEEVEQDYYKWERKFLNLDNVVTFRDVKQRQKEIVLYCDFFDLKELIDIRPIVGSRYIYSISEPHDEEAEIDYQRMLNWLKHFKLPMVQAHSSGHASWLGLKKIINSIKPKAVIPVHTEHPKLFYRLLKSSRIRVKLPRVGEPLLYQS